MPWPPTVALARFHMSTGAAIALRSAVPIGGVLTVAIGMSADPVATLSRLATAIAEGEGPAAAVVLLLSLTLAGWGADRLAGDGARWLRHLPAGADARRRGAVAGLVWVQLPMIVLSVAACLANGRAVRVAGAALAAVAVAQAALATRRRWLTLPFSCAAAWLAATGGTRGLAIAAGLVALADLAAGPMHEAPALRVRRPIGPRAFSRRIAWRALGPGVLAAAAPSLFPVIAAALVVVNNELPVADEARAVRLGAVLAGTFAAALVGERLAVRRPPWPWERALPRSARGRVLDDATVLGVAACVPIVPVVAIDPLSAVVGLAAVPALALRGAAAMRRDGAHRTLAAGPLLIEGGFASLVAGLLPWSAVVFLAAVPWALRAAERAERERSVVRWIALHHHARGDSASWSGR